MPALSTEDWNIDYEEAGTGSPVVLIHSSVSGNRQWRSLTEALKNHCRVLTPNFYEWDAVVHETTTIDAWASLKVKTLVVYAADTGCPRRDIVELFVDACGHWSFAEIAGGGHMVPLFQPELVRPIVTGFLNSIEDSSLMKRPIDRTTYIVLCIPQCRIFIIDL